MIRELLIQAWDNTVPIFVGNVIFAMVVCAAFLSAPFVIALGGAVFVAFALLSVWCVLMSVLICWTTLAALVRFDDPAPALRGRMSALVTFATLVSPAILGVAGLTGAAISASNGGPAFYALSIFAVWLGLFSVQTLLLATTFVASGAAPLRAIGEAVFLGLLHPFRAATNTLVALALMITSVICFPGLGGTFLWLRAATGRATEIGSRSRRHLSPRALLQPWLR